MGRYQRVWTEVQERARELAGLCVSLHDARTVLAWTNGQPVACGTLQGWGHQAAALAEALHAGPLRRVPPVVLLDGLWIKHVVETGERYMDRHGRDRPKVQRARVPLLVTYRVDPPTGERWLVDWERAEQEDQASWQPLLERLQARGLGSAAGFTLFVHDGGSGLETALNAVEFGSGVLRQRCVFHVLSTVQDAVRGEAGMSREAKQAQRRDLGHHRAGHVPPALAAVCGHLAGARARRSRRAGARVRDDARVLHRHHLGTRAGRALGAALPAHDQRARTGQSRAAAEGAAGGAFRAEAAIAAAVALVAAHRHLARDLPPADLWTESLECGLLAA